MKGLLSTAASRAWLGVMIVGLIVVAIVIGLQLHPRLSAGQSLVDATKPVMTDRAVAGEVAGTRLLFATLSELPGLTGGWRNVPGMQGLDFEEARLPA